jgi:hypothetical protein
MVAIASPSFFVTGVERAFAASSLNATSADKAAAFSRLYTSSAVKNNVFSFLTIRGGPSNYKGQLLWSVSLAKKRL